MAVFTYALHATMPDACVGGVLTLGNFDGVHRGHQALLAETARQARALGGPRVAVTFDPHPSLILRPDRIGPPLTTLDDRIALLLHYGADHVLVLQTTSELLQLSAREFFEEIVVRRLRAEGIVEGYNFAFGHNREGTIDVLKSLCEEKDLLIWLMPPQVVLGQPVSSSRVRTELSAGNVDVVAQLLGRPHRITGVVGVGAKRGATLGFPTANLDGVATLLPGHGVYAVTAIVDGARWPAAANIGPNPTFGEHARKIEAHLIGFSGDLYGKQLAIEFVQKIRDTKRFESAAELAAQIRADVEVACGLARHSC